MGLRSLQGLGPVRLKGLDLLSKVFDGKSYKEVDMQILLKYWYLLPGRWTIYRQKKSAHKKIRKLLDNN